MVEFVTKSELRGAADKLRIDEQVSYRKRASSRSLQGSTFLSHSSKDDDLIIGAARVLEDHGASVYIDRKDPTLPPYTNSDTARILKNRIDICKKFVLLATQNSKDSKWVPWELGIGDGYKPMSSIAIFPASEKSNETSWASWEYLGLYDRIVWGKIKGDQKDGWIVLNKEKNTAIHLRRWFDN